MNVIATTVATICAARNAVAEPRGTAAKHRHVDADARAAPIAENIANRTGTTSPEHPVVQRDQIFHRDDVIELALALGADAERIGQLARS